MARSKNPKTAAKTTAPSSEHPGREVSGVDAPTLAPSAEAYGVSPVKYGRSPTVLFKFDKGDRLRHIRSYGPEAGEHLTNEEIDSFLQRGLAELR